MRKRTLSLSEWIPRISLRAATLIAAVGLLVALFAGAAVSWAAPPSQAHIPGTPCVLGTKACVDLNTYQAWLITYDEKGNLVKIYDPVQISTGDAGMETPTGIHHVLRKDAHFYSTEYHVPMPWSVFFAKGGIALHEGDVNVGSAGCIHLPPGQAQFFFDRLNVGDVVEVH